MRQRGSVTFWLLGLSFAMLTLGVLSVDLWALIAERRELAAVADAAATAAATAIDEGEWRSSQVLMLDRDEAIRRALPLVEDLQASIDFGADGVTVTVSVRRTVETALLGLAGREAVTVGASSVATASLRD
ncbi:MAG TPA: pilus assembly protein TadG-related protein [Acidimicrobiia bacterium]|nr:pilus assembly protein TadG-related protein [Acidimicrobiia bacterium]